MHNKAQSKAYKKKKRVAARLLVQGEQDHQHAGEGETGVGGGGQVVEGKKEGKLFSKIVGMVPYDWSEDAIGEEEGGLVARDPTPVPE